MHAQHPEIRRRPDGSIDIDFYRLRGLIERRAVQAGFFKRIRRIKSGLIAIAVLAMTVAVLPSHDGTGGNGNAMPGNGPSAAFIHAANAAR